MTHITKAIIRKRLAELLEMPDVVTDTYTRFRLQQIVDEIDDAGYNACGQRRSFPHTWRVEGDNTGVGE